MNGKGSKQRPTNKAKFDDNDAMISVLCDESRKGRCVMIETIYDDNNVAVSVSCDEIGFTISKRIETGGLRFSMNPVFKWDEHHPDRLDDLIEVIERAKQEFKL